jgi:hypothetical protein
LGFWIGLGPGILGFEEVAWAEEEDDASERFRKRQTQRLRNGARIRQCGIVQGRLLLACARFDGNTNSFVPFSSSVSVECFLFQQLLQGRQVVGFPFGLCSHTICRVFNLEGESTGNNRTKCAFDRI